MKRKNLLIILLALAFHAAGLETAKATCSMSPTANITTEPVALVFYTGESVHLSGATSVANCGSINEYRWRVRPAGGEYTTLYQGSSSTWNHTFTLASGVSEQRYDVELRIRNSVGLYNFKTIQVTVTRNNKSLYYLTDHLGSVRVTVNERGDPVGWDDYYPFGLQMPGRNQNASNANDDAKFTGYELEQQGGLGLYHAGARMYDPEIGRFMSVDPLAQEYPAISPYVYALNNPLIFIDPDGKAPIFIDEETAKRVVNDLNAVMSRIYNTDQEAFSLSELTTLFVKGGKISGEVEGYVIQVNADFNFGSENATEIQREYNEALVESIQSNHHYVVRESSHGEYQGYIGSGPLVPRKDAGGIVGGQTPNPHTVLLAPGLFTDDQRGGGNWTYAGTFMHEVVYHLHEKGLQNPNPTIMQAAFGFTRSSRHGPGRFHRIPTIQDRQR